MKANVLSKSLILTVLFLSLLSLTALAAAQSSNKEQETRRCSNHTLFGDYGTDAQGLLLPAPGVSLQFRGLSMTHFDGRGGLSWVEHTVIDGQPVHPGWVQATGSYVVNPDCTGTAIVNTPFSQDPLVFAIVVVNAGKEVRAVLDSNAISVVFVRVN